MTNARPAFDDLPLGENDPKASAWGLWGNDDELGTLNLLTPQVIASATQEVKTGKVIPLNLPLDGLVRPMNPARKPCSHRINAKGTSNDDALDIDTQGSSHWDGPRHFPYQDTLQYYNGVTQDAISGATANHKLGVQNMARKTITGRGVLLDWFSWAQQSGISIDAFSQDGIPLSQLLTVADHQGVSFKPGDILLIRTGWLVAYRALPMAERATLPDRAVRASCGVEASEEAIRWHWERAFSAVASDTVAYEVWPSPRGYGVSMHEVFLSGWGMPIGESFAGGEVRGAGEVDVPLCRGAAGRAGWCGESFRSGCHLVGGRETPNAGWRLHAVDKGSDTSKAQLPTVLMIGLEQCISCFATYINYEVI